MAVESASCNKASVIGGKDKNYIKRAYKLQGAEFIYSHEGNGKKLK